MVMMMTRRRFLILAGAAAGAAVAPAIWAALGRAPADAGAPAIQYGRDRCDACGMIISDARFAAAARQGARVSRYDDIGCLARHAGRELARGQAQGYVHDAGTEQWLDAGGAAYVRSPAIRTPMGTGVAAYATPDAARAAHPSVPVVALDQLLEVWMKERM
jgi:copper chaperone NosL